MHLTHRKRVGDAYGKAIRTVSFQHNIWFWPESVYAFGTKQSQYYENGLGLVGLEGPGQLSKFGTKALMKIGWAWPNFKTHGWIPI